MQNGTECHDFLSLVLDNRNCSTQIDDDNDANECKSASIYLIEIIAQCIGLRDVDDGVDNMLYDGLMAVTEANCYGHTANKTQQEKIEAAEDKRKNKK